MGLVQAATPATASATKPSPTPSLPCPPRPKRLGRDGKVQGWIFLDLNNQADEVRTARELAMRGVQSRWEPVHVFRSVKDLESYLTTHPQKDFSTLVISGHYVAHAFTSGDGLSSRDFDAMVQRHPGLASITGMTALGCYAGLTANAWDWAMALPKLRYLASFALQAPSDVPSTAKVRSGWLPSSTYLKRVEEARGCLEKDSLSLTEQQKIFDQVKKYKTTELPASVLTFDIQKDNSQAPHSRAQVTSAFEGAGKVTQADAVCAKTARNIQQIFATKFVNFQPRPRSVPEVIRRYQLNKIGDPYVSIPKDLPYSELRLLYAHIQSARFCTDSFYANTPPSPEAAILRQVFGVTENENKSFGEKTVFRYLSSLIMAIHGNEVAKNAVTCAPEFWKTWARRLDRCSLAPDKTVSTNLLLSKPPLRQTLWKATQEYWKGLERAHQQGLQVSSLEEDVFLYCSSVLNGQKIPDSYLEDLKPGSKECVNGSVRARELERKIKTEPCPQRPPEPETPAQNPAPSAGSLHES